MATALPADPCTACGRTVAARMKVQRLHGGGKAKVAHKCPHGLPCIAGLRLAGRESWNPGGVAHSHRCPDCAQTARGKYG